LRFDFGLRAANRSEGRGATYFGVRIIADARRRELPVDPGFSGFSGYLRALENESKKIFLNISGWKKTRETRETP
jgi:hypothetical protein